MLLEEKVAQIILSLSTDTTESDGGNVQSDSDGVNTIGTDGFTVGYTNSTAWNNNTDNYVSWNWKAALTHQVHQILMEL